MICISCQGFQELDKEDSFILIEKWMFQAYLDRHLCSSEYKKVIALMDMSSEQPEIKYHKGISLSFVEVKSALREVMR